jgi:hypothetical protein
MMRTTPVLVAIALDLSAALAAAQTCAGTASFSGHPVQLSAGLSTTKGGKSYAVGMAVGAAGPFVGVGLSRAEYEGFEGAETDFAARAGYAINLNATKTFQFCPTADFGYGTGPDFVVEATTVHTSGRGMGLGGSIGGVVPVTQTFDFVPSVGGSYEISRVTVSANGVSNSESWHWGGIGVGAGFVINKILSLEPAVSVPLGLGRTQPTFSLNVGFNFGGSFKR